MSLSCDLAVLGDGLKFELMEMTAEASQLAEQAQQYDLVMESP